MVNNFHNLIIENDDLTGVPTVVACRAYHLGHAYVVYQHAHAARTYLYAHVVRGYLSRQFRVSCKTLKISKLVRSVKASHLIFRKGEIECWHPSL